MFQNARTSRVSGMIAAKGSKTLSLNTQAASQFSLFFKWNCIQLKPLLTKIRERSFISFLSLNLPLPQFHQNSGLRKDGAGSRALALPVETAQPCPGPWPVVVRHLSWRFKVPPCQTLLQRPSPRILLTWGKWRTQITGHTMSSVLLGEGRWRTGEEGY